MLKLLKRVGLALLLLIAVLAVLFYVNPQIQPSHTEPYVKLVKEKQGPPPAESDILQRVVLYGDAGHSTMEPWQASMAAVARRASISPDKTVVVALGDNIYMRGYPRKETGQQEWDKDQLESISFLDAQLKVARDSGASMYLVPGNHDWYASELDGQAAHIAEYAKRHKLDLHFEPYEKGEIPLPESANLNGISIVFIDTEWLLLSKGEDRKRALAGLAAELARVRAAHPDHTLLLTAHHPLETMGPHGGYLAEFDYWFVMKLAYAITDAMDEDVTGDIYKAMIADINRIAGKHENVIFAAGHEHSLQVFRRDNDHGPEYTLVSGAGNENKVSGVWHTPQTRFALAQEGFMELNVTAEGVYLQVFDSRFADAVSGFWLAF